jgi:hypothetical protein
MQNILHHTVIAKKKGPHTLGALPRSMPETFAEACSLWIRGLTPAMPHSRKRVARGRPRGGDILNGYFHLPEISALNAPDSVWERRENLQPERCLPRRATPSVNGQDRHIRRE